jgi:AAA+ superfamily predicted ATPase
VVCVTINQDAAGTAGAAGRNTAQVIKIRDDLQDGRRIFLSCAHPQDVPPDLAALVLGNIDLPTVDLDLIYALHCLLYPKAARLSLADFAGIPSLEAVSPGDLALALSFDQTVPVAQTLTKLIKCRQSSTLVAQSPGLEDQVGNTAAVTLGLQICQDLIAWQQGELDWSDVVNGMLLSGPPGSGKTVFVNALAQSSGTELYKVSYSDCAGGGQRGSSGIIDHLLATGRRAAASQKAIVFIDEIDGFGQNRFGQQDHNSTYYRTMTTALLRFCNDMRASPGVILIAATNDVPAVDPAVIRAGRFDHHITLSAPALNEINTLLARDLPALPADMVTEVAKHLLGASFADVASFIRSVKLQARKNKRDPAPQDLTAVLDHFGADDPVSEEDLWRIAVHEAGHIIVDYVQSGSIAAQVTISGRGGNVLRQHAIPVNFTAARLHDLLSLLLAGRAAERLILGSVGSGSGAGENSDLRKATYYALSARQNWHLSQSADLIWCDVPGTLSAPGDPRIRDEIVQLLRAREQAAHDILARHRSAVVTFAEALILIRDMHHAEIEIQLRALIPDPATQDMQMSDDKAPDPPTARPNTASSMDQ